jgi:RNA polymerase primary sigma factor
VRGLRTESRRNKEIFIDLFGLLDGKPKPETEIARKNKLTRERIRQIKARILGKLEKNPKMRQFKP